jgi:hypothetical protein
MRVRLNRKLANVIDGLDVSGCRVGDVLDLPPRDALLLVAEGWAQLEERSAARETAPRAYDRQPIAHDRSPRRPGKRRK